MNQTFFAGQLRLLMVAFLAFAGGRGWMTPTDSTFALAVVSSLGPIFVPWLWSIYVNYGGKIVPKDSIAVAKTSVSTPDQMNAKAGDFITVDGTAKVVGAILLAVLISSFTMDRSYAQARTISVTGNPAAFGTTNPLQTVAQFIAKWTEDDLNAAIALSSAVPELQDPIGGACWGAFSAMGKVMKEHPLPATFKLASDIEAARLFVRGVKQVCAKPECAQVWMDINNQINALAVIPIPSLPSLCAKIPG